METVTFVLDGPEWEPCAVCSATGVTITSSKAPACVKCGGKGKTRKPHTYVVTRHMMVDGLALVDDLMTLAGVGTGATETVATFANSITSKIARDLALAGRVFSGTTRDGAAIDIEAAYRSNYTEYFSALMRVCDVNGFFGPPASI